ALRAVRLLAANHEGTAMETGDSRSRGKTNDNGKTIAHRTDAAEAPIDGPRTLRRATSAPLPSGTVPRALPDTFSDERDDVLAVINELEDQLDRNEQIREQLERELTEQASQQQAGQQRIQELEWQIVTSQTRIEALEQVKQTSHAL